MLIILEQQSAAIIATTLSIYHSESKFVICESLLDSTSLLNSSTSFLISFSIPSTSTESILYTSDGIILSTKQIG